MVRRLDNEALHVTEAENNSAVMFKSIEYLLVIDGRLADLLDLADVALFLRTHGFAKAGAYIIENSLS